MKQYARPSVKFTEFDVDDMLMASGAFGEVRETGDGTATNEISFSKLFDKTNVEYDGLYN